MTGLHGHHHRTSLTTFFLSLGHHCTRDVITLQQSCKYTGDLAYVPDYGRTIRITYDGWTDVGNQRISAS